MRLEDCKPGVIVRCYDSTSLIKTVIERIHSDGYVFVRGIEHGVWPKQLRRIKIKPKKIGFWINIYSDDFDTEMFGHASKSAADKSASEDRINRIRCVYVEEKTVIDPDLTAVSTKYLDIL